MAGYCDQCDRHCPLTNLGCGRGYRKYGNNNEESPTPRDPYGKHEHHGEHDHRGEHHDHRSEHHDHRGEHHDHRGEHHDHHGKCHDHHGEHHDHRGEHHEHHGEHHDHHGEHHDHRGEHEHHGEHGRRHHGPSQEELQSRLETGDLSELLHMCAHVMHHRPEAGAARGQGKVMSILADHGTISQRQLQDMLHIQPGSMSEIITKLESKGLLIRTRAEDRRGNMLTITDEGRALAQKEDISGGDLFSALDESEQYQLRTLLQKLLTDWLQRFDPRFRRNS